MLDPIYDIEKLIPRSLIYIHKIKKSLNMSKNLVSVPEGIMSYHATNITNWK